MHSGDDSFEGCTELVISSIVIACILFLAICGCVFGRLYCFVRDRGGKTFVKDTFRRYILRRKGMQPDNDEDGAQHVDMKGSTQMKGSTEVKAHTEIKTEKTDPKPDPPKEEPTPPASTDRP